MPVNQDCRDASCKGALYECMSMRGPLYFLEQGSSSAYVSLMGSSAEGVNHGLQHPIPEHTKHSMQVQCSSE